MLWLLFLVQIHAAGPLPGSSGESAIPAVEREILMDLYRATDGAHWDHNTGWGGLPGTECEWYGVTCTEPGSGPANHVELLELADNHLVGPLPESLARLEYLIWLDLHEDQITPPIPEALLERWDRGRLELNIGGPIDQVEEIRLTLITNSYCVDEAIIFRSDGTAFYYRDACENRSSAAFRHHCEERRGESVEFPRILRFLRTHAFFGPHEEVFDCIDCGETTVTLRGPRGVVPVTIGPNGDDSLDAWSYEMVIRGVAQATEWSEPEHSDKCPWVDGPRQEQDPRR